MSRFVARVSRAAGARAVFRLGYTKPNAGNTGVVQSVSLIDVTSPTLVTVPGQVIEGRRFLHYVFVKAANVTFRNCEFLGPTSTTFYSDGQGNYGYGLINVRDAAATGTLIERCTIRPQSRLGPGFWWLVGVSVHNGGTATVTRCDISCTVDAINAGDQSSSVVAAYGNYVHDLAFYNNCTDQASSTPPYWTHNDGIQLLGGSGHQIIGNNFEEYLAPIVGMSGVTATVAGYNDTSVTTGSGVPSARNARGAGITISSDYSQVLNCMIKQNWFEGGAVGFQMNSLNNGTTGTTVGYLGENRFGMDQHNYDTTGNTSMRAQIMYKQGNIFNGLTTNYFDPEAISVPPTLRGVAFTVSDTGGIRVLP